MAMPNEYMQMLEQLPQSLRDSLPQEVFTTDAESAARAWQAMSSPTAILQLLFEQLTTRWQAYLTLFLRLCGILLLRGVYGCMATNVRSGALSGGVSMLVRLLLYAALVGEAVTQLESVRIFYEQLQGLSAAFLPLMGVMYATGGNVGTAVVNHASLIFVFSLVEWLGGKTVIPLFTLCLAFSLLGVFDAGVAGRMQILTGKIKKWYTTGLSLVMLLLTATLAAQSTLSARADSMGFRTVRFAVSSSVPLIGGGVAEMLRTAATGLSFMRSTVGVGGILLLLALLLPHILSLWLTRAVWSLAGDVGSFLGCGEESRLLGEVASLYGYLLAVLCVSVLTFFFALVLLCKCGVAYAA